MSLREHLDEIKTMLQTGETQRGIARRYGCTHAAISLVLNTYDKEWWKEFKARKPVTNGRCVICAKPLSRAERVACEWYGLPDTERYCYEHTPKELKKTRRRQVDYTQLKCRVCGKTKSLSVPALQRLRQLGRYVTAEPAEDGTWLYFCRKCLSGKLFAERVLPKILAHRERVSDQLRESTDSTCVVCGGTLKVRVKKQMFALWSNPLRGTRVCFRCSPKVCKYGSKGLEKGPDSRIILDGYAAAVQYACGCVETRLVRRDSKCPEHGTEVVKVYESIGELPDGTESIQARKFGAWNPVVRRMKW